MCDIVWHHYAGVRAVQKLHLIMNSISP